MPYLDVRSPAVPASAGYADLRSGFNPTQCSAVRSWLRLQASAQSGGRWLNWVDVMNSSPAVATSGQRPLVGSSNGLPTAVFTNAGNETLSWLLTGANNFAAPFGLWMRVKIASSLTNRYVMACDQPDASLNRWLLNFAGSGAIAAAIYSAAFNDRTITSGNGALVNGVSTPIGFTLDPRGATEVDRLKLIVGASYVSGSFSGTGVSDTGMTSPTGSLAIGDYRATGGVGGWNGEMGPNIYVLNRHLTDGELFNFAAYEPTF